MSSYDVGFEAGAGFLRDKIGEMPEPILEYIGLPCEWANFARRHKVFLERLPNLLNALNLAFDRHRVPQKPVDKVVFHTGELCVKDFKEFICLCGNGHGNGAIKILRGMFERVVTATYLSRHPEETDDYLDYYWVNQHKLINAVKSTLGKDVLPQGDVAAAEIEFKKVKDRYFGEGCKKCRAKRLNHTWSKLDIVAMAKRAGLDKLVVPGYYFPMGQSHATVYAILSRLREENGGVHFSDAHTERRGR